MKDVLLSVVLDRSGSMSPVREDTIGGFNSFLADQRKVKAKVRVSLVQFDHEYRVDLVAEPIKKVKDLDHESYQPRGMTALNDAIMKSLDATEEWVKKSGWKGRVLTLIATDGMENASLEYVGPYGLKMVANRVARLTEEGWDFVFLGADMDAMAAGAVYNIVNTSSYGSHDTRAAWATTSASASTYIVSGDVKEFKTRIDTTGGSAR